LLRGLVAEQNVLELEVVDGCLIATKYARQFDNGVWTDQIKVMLKGVSESWMQIR
jgi:hypothetical protein